MHDDDIRQRDLSGKRVEQMTRAERQELKRRLEEFMVVVGKEPAAGPARKPKVRRWDPAADTRK